MTEYVKVSISGSENVSGESSKLIFNPTSTLVRKLLNNCCKLYADFLKGA